MEPHQSLRIVLPKLLAKLTRSGLSKRAATTVCKAIADGTPPRRIAMLEAYQKAWIICDAMEDVLTTLDD